MFQVQVASSSKIGTLSRLQRKNMHNVTLKLYWIYARARAAIQAKGHIQYCLVGSIDLPWHCHLKGPYYRDGVPIGTLLALHCYYTCTRSLWALRARLLVGGPSGRFRPFGPAFGPSGLQTHYPTANTLSNPWIVC